jgi:hypothetical protein
MTPQEIAELQRGLAGFCGSETFQRHPIVRSTLLTEGARYLADKAGAWWLMDKIAILGKGTARLAREPFQTWKLTVKGRDDNRLVMTDGDTDDPIYAEVISYTDFPLPEITLWAIEQEDPEVGRVRIVMLPSEY